MRLNGNICDTNLKVIIHQGDMEITEFYFNNCFTSHRKNSLETAWQIV